ncbi:MAG TPA: PIN domain-containing protein [Gemmataceae bacterium]|nr:PIN domain-containing protein [Gemmataceae bacterium]
MIVLDSAVVMKWYKHGERHEAEALDLRQRIERREVEAAVSELVPLEVVRGLKVAQRRDPSLGLTDAAIESAFANLLTMSQSGVLSHFPVTLASAKAKDIILALGLFMADAVQLATAVVLGAQYFATENHHFTAPFVCNGAAAMGVSVVDVPQMIAILNASGGGPVTTGS